MTAEEFWDVSLEGLKNMMMPILLMILAFLFAEVNEQIHFTYFVITSATKVITPALLPLIVFIALAITEFITGTNWGMYIIALPIVIPLAQNLGSRCDTGSFRSAQRRSLRISYMLLLRRHGDNFFGHRLQ